MEFNMSVKDTETGKPNNKLSRFYFHILSNNNFFIKINNCVLTQQWTWQYEPLLGHNSLEKYLDGKYSSHKGTVNSRDYL